MKAEYEVGEYVRTRVGEIYKVTKIDENYGLVYFDKTYWGWSREELDTIIKKHSKNIIDLIEVGDIVKYNDMKITVYDIDKTKDFVADRNGKSIYSWNIQSVLTYEQYENDCYRLEEEE